MAFLDGNVDKIRQLGEKVAQTVLVHAEESAIRRQVPPLSEIPFDTSRIWLVESGHVSVRQSAKELCVLSPFDIVGPWCGGVSPLSFVTHDEGCRLVGFDQGVLTRVLAADIERLKLWCSFQSLTSAYFFAAFARLEVARTPPAPARKVFSAGQTLVREGEPGSEVFLLLQGRLDVFVKGQRVGEIQRDELFGVLAAMTEGVRTATVLAVEDSECMVFSRDDFRDHVRSSPLFMEKLFEDFARAIGDLNISVLKATHTRWGNLF